MTDQSNQHIADRQAWDKERQRLETEVARLKELLTNIIEGYTILVNADNSLKRAAMSDFLNMEISAALRALKATDPQQSTFNKGVEVGRELASYSELPY